MQRVEAPGTMDCATGRWSGPAVLDVDLIETPENVELQRRLAGIGSRFIAGLLDILIVLAGLILLGLILLLTVGLRGLGLARGSDAGKLVLAGVVVVFFLASFQPRVGFRYQGVGIFIVCQQLGNAYDLVFRSAAEV